MKKNIFISIAFILFVFTLSSQRMIFQRDSAFYQTTPRKWGRNADNMIYPYAQLSWAVGSQEPGAILDLGSSVNFRLGIDYKRKITKWLHVGAKIQYATETFQITQRDDKLLPDTMMHQQEWFNLQNFVSGAFLRFNLGLQKQNQYGLYLETGVNHVLIARFNHSFIDQLPGGEKKETHIYQLNYTEPNYGEAYIKFGWSHFAALTTVRFTGLWRNGSVLQELPFIKLGMELSY